MFHIFNKVLGKQQAVDYSEKMKKYNDLTKVLEEVYFAKINLMTISRNTWDKEAVDSLMQRLDVIEIDIEYIKNSL